MPNHEAVTSTTRESSGATGSSSSYAGSGVQLKAALHGHGFEAQAAMLEPPPVQMHGGFGLGAVQRMNQDNPLHDEPGYHGPKPRYENPGHHDPSSPNYIRGKTPLPADAEAAYARAVPELDGQTWWGLGGSGDIYRYQGNNGMVHWNGSESSGTRPPAAIRRRLTGRGA